MIEKAEAGAIGRALAFLGYGTQFAQELETEHTSEGAKVVDTPRTPKPAVSTPAVSKPKESQKAVQQPLINEAKVTVAKPSPATQDLNTGAAMTVLQVALILLDGALSLFLSLAVT